MTAESTISVMELEYGSSGSVRPAETRHTVEELLSLVTVLPFDHDAAVRAGHVRAVLKTKGKPIGPYDALIAGHALSRGMTIVTNNSREFDHVPGLVVEDWLH